VGALQPKIFKGHILQEEDIQGNYFRHAEVSETIQHSGSFVPRQK